MFLCTGNRNWEFWKQQHYLKNKTKSGGKCGGIWKHPLLKWDLSVSQLLPVQICKDYTGESSLCIDLGPKLQVMTHWVSWMWTEPCSSCVWEPFWGPQRLHLWPDVPLKHLWEGTFWDLWWSYVASPGLRTPSRHNQSTTPKQLEIWETSDMQISLSAGFSISGGSRNGNPMDAKELLYAPRSLNTHNSVIGGWSVQLLLSSFSDLHTLDWELLFLLAG